ncbi:hypothetical protein FB45DRAFT_942790 [Roridomyces roridus]|uniref:Zn(2)-C6 fungal-type domain-containing protein n=1 Tax=Roridomyces roridus TaxID=1738132 RepID=A0AAD7B4Z1_9AGAR|nr:hypothetical protein FB45DRAFT_942790 [Roridomyces roridus]
MHRRAKNTQACQACRKSKTRCEVLDADELPLTCHRCKVLVVDCSYMYTQVQQSALVPSPPSVLGKRGRSDAESRRHLWSFISPRGHDIDWSKPLQAIQSLATLKSTNLVDLEHAFSGFTLSTVRPDSRIERLIDLFHEKHAPWLDFQPIRNSANPLVDIACASIASRHLSGSDGEQVRLRLRLQGLARDSVAQMIFGCGELKDTAADSLEAVQCLIMLALWGPFGVDSEPWPWDARELIAVAVKMAGRMKLDRASEELEGIWKRALVDDMAALKLSEAAERMRLWVTLTNVESMLSMGASPSPSRRTATHYLWTRFPDPFVNDVDLCNLRLGFLAEQFDFCETGIALRPSPDTNMEQWTSRVNAVLEDMKRGSRLLGPLPYVLPTQHQPYFHALHITEHTARILVLHNGLLHARRSLPESSWRSQIHALGSPTKFLGTWSRDFIQTSEVLLVALLGIPTTVLATAPDSVYDMCALAAGYLVGIKLLAFHSSKEGFRGSGALRGASDLLLRKTARKLSEAGASCGLDHRAIKCAALVKEMIDKWEARDSGSSDSADSAHPDPLALGGGNRAAPRRPGVPVDRSGGLVFHMQCEEPPVQPRIVVEPELEPAEMEVEVEMGGNDLDMAFWDSIMMEDSAFDWNSLIAGNEY